MGFLSDLKKARAATKKATAAVAKAKKAEAQKAKARTVQPTVTSTLTVNRTAGKQRSETYADADEFDPLPVLTLRDWDYGQGLNPGSEGFGFTAPDGRIWPAKNCKITLFKKLGVLDQPVVGLGHHPECADESFAPGMALRLVAEPENEHSPKAIAVRNWANTMTAGYIPEDRVTRLRNLLRDQTFFVMSLNRTREGGRPTRMHLAIWLPGRVKGAAHVAAAPPIADPPK